MTTVRPPSVTVRPYSPATASARASDAPVAAASRKWRTVLSGPMRSSHASVGPVPPQSAGSHARSAGSHALSTGSPGASDASSAGTPLPSRAFSAAQSMNSRPAGVSSAPLEVAGDPPAHRPSGPGQAGRRPGLPGAGSSQRRFRSAGRLRVAIDLGAGRRGQPRDPEDGEEAAGQPASRSAIHVESVPRSERMALQPRFASDPIAPRAYRAPDLTSRSDPTTRPDPTARPDPTSRPARTWLPPRAAPAAFRPAARWRTRHAPAR